MCEVGLFPYVSQLEQVPDLEECDISHAGLLLGGKGQLSLTQLSSTNWLFLDPHAERRTTSWKATPALCWLRPKLIQEMGGVDPAYQSPITRLMDLAYRVLVAGGRVCHEPAWLTNQETPVLSANLPLVDQFVFLQRHLGSWATTYATFWSYFSIKDKQHIWKNFWLARQLVKQYAAPFTQTSPTLHLVGEKKKQTIERISAIIPTINRYEYLPQAIDSLLRSTPAVNEIIVVDQTPIEHRQMAIYNPYSSEKVRVFFLDEAGQSVARNTAIQAAKGEWCLLFEDDTVAWDDMLAQHVHVLEYSGAHASTGVSLAPWKNVEYIPQRIRHYHIADVLATGNALVKKSVLQDVHGLDRAFDRGSGADHDLGVRLYLAGYEIVFNYKAIETHYKAPSGGMRTYGAWWRHRSTFWSPFPPPTQVYTIQRYYVRSFWLPLYLLYFLKAMKQHNTIELVWLWLSAPWKLVRSLRLVKKLKEKSAFLEQIEEVV